MKVKKFSKFLSLLLTFMLAVGLLPVTALAASSEEVATPDLLISALANASNGTCDTITLKNDITNLTTTNFSVNVATQKTVTIDGQGYTITAADTAGGTSTALEISGDGTVILKNITFKGGAGSKSYGLYISSGSTITVQSVGTVSAIGGAATSNNSYGLYHDGSGTVIISEAVGGSGEKSCGIWNNGTGTVYAETATGGAANFSIGVDNFWMGIVNVGAASGGSAALYSVGVYNSGGGTVNAVSAVGGSATCTNSYSYGVWNGIGCKVNAATASGGEAYSSYGVSNYGGTVNANAASGGSHTTNVYESYGVYNENDAVVCGTINVTTATGGTAANSSYGAKNYEGEKGGVINVQTATSAAAASIHGDTVGNSIHTGAGVATLTLNKGAGAFCVLDSITVAGLGATEIGVLPLVSKDGTEGTWYTDEDLNNAVADSSVTGATALYSSFYVKATVPALSGGSVSRTSDTAATISFTTDEAGTAYYSVVDKDATAPTKEAVAARTSLGSVSGTVADKAITLTAGDKDIYVVVKNASDNISDPLKIAAAAYVSPVETLANTLTNVGLSAAVSGNTVTVTSTDTKVATDTLQLAIPAGVTVQWKASLTGDVSPCLVFLNGDGTFELAGGKITNTEKGMAVGCSQGSIVISGGTASSSSDFATVQTYYKGSTAPMLTMTGGNVISTSDESSSCAISAGGKTVITGGTVTAESGNQVVLSNAVVVYQRGLLSKISSGSLSASVAVSPSKTYAVPTETDGLTATGYSVLADHVTAQWNYSNSGWTGVQVDYSESSSGSWQVSYPAVQVVSGRHSLSYRENGGTGAVTPQNTVYKGQSYTVSTNVFTRTNYTFTGWNTEADGTGTPYAAGATLIGGPGSDDILLYAQWSPTGGGSNPSGGGGGGGGVSTPSTTVPTTSGATATTTVTAQTGTNGTASASVTQTQVTSAIEKAQAAAKSSGEAPSVEIHVSGGSNATAVQTTIPKAAVQAMVSGKMDSLTLSGPVAAMTFDAQAISAIAGAASGDVAFASSKVDNSILSDAVRQTVGDHPVYNFSVTSGGSTISQFGGAVTVSVPYTPAAGENPDAIVAYYINANGEPELMQNCHYDAQTGTLVFTTTHFSTYAVGYHKVAFSDVAEDATL